MRARYPIALIALVTCAVVVAPANAATVSSFGLTGSGPIGITLDSAGNVYTANNGASTVSLLGAGGGGAAGAPWPVGSGGGSGINSPRGVVYTDAGSVFISNDVGSVSRIITSTGSPFGLLWPVSTGLTPIGIAADRAGNIYTANLNGNSVTRVSTAGTGATFATTGAGTNPIALAFDGEGNLYTANDGSGTVSKFTAAGTPAGAPWPVSFGLAAEGITIDSAGNVYVATDTSWSVSRITPAGTVTTIPLGAGTLPKGITVDSAGNVYTANAGTATVSKITPGGTVSTIATGGGLNGPTGITIDRDGNLFVSNYNGATVSKITPAGGDIQPAPPETPFAPSATAGDGSATVTVPANEVDRRYGAPSSYSVTAVEAPSRTCTVTPPATSCQVTGLSNGTAYTFTARANLNTWQTGASSASFPVTPASAPTPTPTPDPTPSPATMPAEVRPTPTPAPTPSATVAVASITKKVARTGARITSKVTVSGTGTITQRATTGSKKLKAWCRVSTRTSAAGPRTITCNLGSKGREALRKGSLKLTLRTTFAPSAGAAVSVNRVVSIPRRR